MAWSRRLTPPRARRTRECLAAPRGRCVTHQPEWALSCTCVCARACVRACVCVHECLHACARACSETRACVHTLLFAMSPDPCRCCTQRRPTCRTISRRLRPPLSPTWSGPCPCFIQAMAASSWDRSWRTRWFRASWTRWPRPWTLNSSCGSCTMQSRLRRAPRARPSRTRSRPK